MNFIQRNRVPLLFGTGGLVLILALFWPEVKKAGDMQKYYSLPQDQLESIEYSGEMYITDVPTVSAPRAGVARPVAPAEAGKARVEYTIQREVNVLKAKEPLYRVEIKNLSTKDKALVSRIAELSELKKFYASALVRTIVQDWSELDYYYILKHEIERDQEYGLKDCPNRLKLNFRSVKKSFCIGSPTQGDTRRYLVDLEKDKVLITPDYTIRRIMNNIFAQREQSLYPHGSEGADVVELQIGADPLRKLPILREKTGGAIKLRMLIKNDGKEKVNVWHVENILSIKPSHAAEMAQLINALRINAPLAVNAQGGAGSAADTMSVLPGVNAQGGAGITDAVRAAGIDATVMPTLSGKVMIRKTDKQDIELASFVFFPPGVKPSRLKPFQLEKQLTRPLDTFVVSQFNAGFLSADLHPRLLSILTKFEADLTEAQKKGEEEKAKREKEKENEKAAPPR